MKSLFLSLSLAASIFSAAVYACAEEETPRPFDNIPSSEQMAMSDGVLSWSAYYVLFAASKKCSNDEYTQMVDIELFNAEITRIFGVSLKDFKVAVSEQSDILDELKQQIEEVHCFSADLEQHLEFYYDKFDLAFSSFEGAMPLAQPIMTQAQIDKHNAQFLADTKPKFDKHFTAASSVYIASVRKYGSVAQKDRDLYFTSMLDAKFNPYIYVVDKGWKKDTSLLVTVGDLNAFVSAKESDEIKKQIEQKLDIPHLYFVDGKGTILASMPVSEANLALKLLGEHHWQWSDATLYHYKDGKKTVSKR